MSTHTWEAPADLSSRTDPYLPLYGASILVHFSLLGAIASTISEPVWLPLWAFIGLVGHLVSWRLRRARVAPGTVYLLAIILGAAWTVLAVSGRGDVAGLSEPLAELSPDFSILVLIGGLASIRCFTLLTVDTLLFGVVPALVALGLSAVDNPNAEIPVFFVLILFGGVFCIIQSEYVRRAKELPTRPPLGLPLAVSWAVVGLVFGGGALFALISQPLLAPLNPYQMPMFSRLRQTFTSRVQSPTDTIPVGAGPISLSSRPIYELYAPGGGLYRTGIAESYTGRGWKPKAMRENPVPDGVATVQFPSEQEENSQELYQFTVPPDPEATAPVRRRVVRQRLVVLVRGTRMIPALARPVRIAIPTDALNLDAKNGTAAAGEVMTGGEGMDILSEVRDVGLRELRNAPSVNPDDPAFESTLELPEDLQQVRDLARRLTRGLTGNYAKVQAIIRHIERTCPYTLNEAPTPRGADPVEYYLFESQRGACDLAGSAAALLCRAVGIPARVAVGYLVDEPLASGDGFLIRGKDAHLWMEAYFPTYGYCLQPLAAAGQPGGEATERLDAFAASLHGPAAKRPD